MADDGNTAAEEWDDRPFVARQLAAVDQASLTPPVRRLLGDDAAQLRTRQHAPLTGGTGTFVHRFSGTAFSPAAGRELPWSLVWKLAVGPPDASFNVETHSWLKEVLVYESDLFHHLPEGVAAPTCFGTERRPDGIAWMWLEEVEDEYTAASRPWPMERYALAARHLGRFNGTFPEARATSRYPWLARGWLRRWVEGETWGGGWREVISNPETWQHPLMRDAYPAPPAERLLCLHDSRAALIDALDRLPHTLCHLDPFRRNLASRRRGTQEETVAFDWPSIGLAALGEDLGKMVATTILFLENDVADAPRLWEAALGSYLDGLRDVAFEGPSERWVRYAAAVSGSLHWACTAAAFPYAALRNEGWMNEEWVQRTFGLPTEDLLARWAPITHWLLDLGDEALRLAPR